MKKLKFSELEKILQEDENKCGVIVFKQLDSWKREFTEEERSYVVSGTNKWFKPWMGGCSLFGTNLTKDDCGVRLDWYMRDPENPWKIDYCYLYEVKEEENGTN